MAIGVVGKSDPGGGDGTVTENWRRELADCLSAVPEVRLAFLFDSEAKGAAHAHSDVDVAVYLREPHSRDIVTKLWNSLEDLLHRDLDLVVLNGAPPGIAWAAFQGKVLVKKDERLYLRKMLEISGEASDLRQYLFELVGLRRRLRKEK
jgi:predicted nucleotidyltransferase